MAKTNKTRSNKKSMNEYEAIQARTQLTPEEQAKYNRNRKIKIIGGVVGGTLLVGAAVTVPLVLINQAQARADREAEEKYNSTQQAKVTDVKVIADAGLRKELESSALEITITIKAPKDTQETREVYRKNVYQSHQELLEDKAKYEKYQSEGSNLGVENNKYKQEIITNDEFQFQSKEIVVTMNQEASHDFVVALSEAATQGDSLSNEILMKIFENQKQKSPSKIIEAYTSAENPNKINLELTSMELDEIISKMSNKHKNIKEGLSELSYIESQKEALQESQQKANNLSHI